MASHSIHLAMWSGPRNISTAMMRAWGNRPDTFVWDEPFYACYLLKTGATYHPGYDATITSHETDWRKVVNRLTNVPPDGKGVFYQKHMAHHLLPEIAVSWVDGFTNCFLIREPRETLASLAPFIPQPKLEETGLPQQVALFRRLTAQQKKPPAVLDARDILENPERMLRLLCDRIGVAFYKEMLKWPPGPRETDGAWAPYWYEKVYQTTGFVPYKPSKVDVPRQLHSLVADCEPLYRELHDQRLR